ncbi:hypothetical protein [Ralstonia syzygii]|uniref:Uncharacterized protein n=1 Tax=Ralstonia syzygii R24 TaxID=907261 RepID=G3A1K6_9RALS|nr:hypothetical protein [Ralstonia syzygii]CCA85106.1 conserved hypothetical protein [Ralstonia syzygii R24]
MTKLTRSTSFFVSFWPETWTISLFAKKLASAGVSVTRESLDEQISAGDFQFILLLQLASLDRIPGFERFVDDCDLAEASLRSQGLMK